MNLFIDLGCLGDRGDDGKDSHPVSGVKSKFFDFRFVKWNDFNLDRASFLGDCFLSEISSVKLFLLFKLPRGDLSVIILCAEG